MDATVNMIVRFRAKAGQEEQLKGVLASLLAPTRREAGCLQYDLWQDTSDPTVLCIVERWESRETHQAHVAAPALHVTLASAGPFFDGPPQAGTYAVL